MDKVYAPYDDPQKFLCRGKYRGTMCARVLAINVQIVATGPDAGIHCLRCDHWNPIRLRPEVTRTPARV